jgi:TnpA family transposase
MLGREPRSEQELLMVYAGILAHGTSMAAAQTARMIPSLTAANVRQAMRWASNEQRLQEACRAVLDFMQRHPITAAWGRSDLASSDMMSLETSKGVWQARIDPRRQTSSIGIYSHVHDRWGIFHAQPIVLNERQAGAAIEGVVRQDKIETSQLATDTHGYTDMAMALGRTLSFDLCPRLNALKERHVVPAARKRSTGDSEIHLQRETRSFVNHGAVGRVRASCRLGRQRLQQCGECADALWLGRARRPALGRRC